MKRVRRLIREVHRRSLWQVLGVYVVASWAVLEVVDTLSTVLQLPGWLPSLALVLLLIGLPVVLATAFIQVDTAQPRSVETIAGSGAAAPPPGPVTEGTGFERLFTWRNAFLGGVGALALWGLAAAAWLAAGAWAGGPVLGGERAPGREAAEAGLPMVAVLPFANLSRDADNEFFAVGVHDELLTHLVRISSLRVISRGSVVPYEDAEADLQRVAEDLGADVVLRGSVQRAGERVRINAQLVDAATGTHLWADGYDRHLEDVFAIQTDVAREVAAALRAALTPSELEDLRTRPTEDLEAYDAYLRALHFLARGVDVEENLSEGLRSLETAVELDPDFAEAWGRMALAHMRMYWFGHDRSPERLTRLRAAAERASELRPGLSEARRAMASLHVLDGRYEDALAELEPAYRDNPGDPEVATSLAGVYRHQGRWEEATRLLERVVELDPLSVTVRHGLAENLWMLGRLDEADRIWERTIAFAPEDLAPYYMRAFLQLAWRGDGAAANAILDAAPQAFLPLTADLRFYADMTEGRPEEGLARLETVPDGLLRNAIFAAPRAMLEGDYLRMMGRKQASGERYAEARRQLLEHLEAGPGDHLLLVSLARTNAALGLEDEAREAEARVGELFPVERDALTGPIVKMGRIQTRAVMGDVGGALAALCRLLDLPSFYTPTWLSIDPFLAGLRGHPEFDRLARGDDGSGGCEPR